MIDINRYVGIPYKEGARGPDAYDCYGLVMSVFEDAGIRLPCWYQGSPGILSASKAIDGAVLQAMSEGKAVRCEPKEMAIVVVRSRDRAHHVGVCLSGGILHSSSPFGSMWHEISRFLALYPSSEFYQWQL